MRTKALLLSAALFAAGLTASTAQSVYSVNAVGYVNLSIPLGFKMIANPLNTTNNTVGVLLADVPDGTTLYKWNETSQQFDIATFFLGAWDHPEYTLNPGEGAFISPNTAFTLTFVGEVMQGSLTNPIPVGYSIRSSKVPQSGTVSSLGVSSQENLSIYQWNGATGQYDIFTFFLGSWAPSEPSLAVGESVFFSADTAFNWSRTFSVN